MQPFRFGALEVFTGSRAQWSETARRVEGTGFSTLQMVDHLLPQLAPVPALMAAASVTTTLRVGTQVFCNDYRHPVMLAKECATLDLLSDGRLEFGIGAGWATDDYAQSGMHFDRPGVRIDRLEEALKVLKGCWGEDPVAFAGEHYQIEGHLSLPKPLQKPHPPILIGGGAKRILSLAGREADIIGINFDLRSDATRQPGAPTVGGIITAEAEATGTAEAVDEKIRWVRESAGDRFDQLEFNITGFITVVTEDVEAAAGSLGSPIGLTSSEVLDLPFVLIGSVERLADVLVERRERYGINYITFPMPLVENGYEALGPLVDRLSGT